MSHTQQEFGTTGLTKKTLPPKLLQPPPPLLLLHLFFTFNCHRLHNTYLPNTPNPLNETVSDFFTTEYQV